MDKFKRDPGNQRPSRSRGRLHAAVPLPGLGQDEVQKMGHLEHLWRQEPESPQIRDGLDLHEAPPLDVCPRASFSAHKTLWIPPTVLRDGMRKAGQG